MFKKPPSTRVPRSGTRMAGSSVSEMPESESCMSTYLLSADTYGLMGYYTHRPLEWRLFIDEQFPGRWDRLAETGLSGSPPDWKTEAAKWEQEIPF